MKRVICDTMIWYNLSRGKLDVPDASQYKLVCTFLSLMELAFTPNCFKNLKDLKETIRFIIELKPDFILYHPTDYIKTIIDNNFTTYSDNLIKLVANFLGVLKNHPDEGLLENQFKSQISDIIEIRKKNQSEWADFLNELYGTAKLDNWIFKKYPLRDLELKHFRDLFLREINSECEFTKIIYQEDSIDWLKFEFYEKVYRVYYRKLLISRMKAEGNDEYDLKNMIYVQPNDLYWTLEKRWLNIIREAKVENYLFNENT